MLPWKLTNARHIFTLRPWLHFVSVFRNVLYIQKIKTFIVEFSLCVHIFLIYVYYTVLREMTGPINWNFACIRKSEEVVLLISIFIMWISLRLRDGEILDWSVRKGHMKFCASAQSVLYSKVRCFVTQNNCFKITYYYIVTVFSREFW